MRLLSLLGLPAHGRGLVADGPALAAFLVGRAAFAAQKVTVEYCRARAGIGWRQLTTEPGFAQALELCRWEAFAAVYPDVAETCQILLRHAGSPRAAVGPGLAAVAADAILAYPAPDHRTGWAEVAGEVGPRLERALLAPPRAVHTLGGPTITRVLGFVPYHPRIRNADRDIIENGLRLALCGIYAELERLADPAPLSAALAAAAPAVC